MEVEIDYITATSSAQQSSSGLDSFGYFLVENEVRKGEQARPYRTSSYRGLAAGSVSTGRRFDGAILRLSGEVAAENWQQAVSLSTNVSRLDLQVTVRPTEAVQDRLRRHLAELRKAKRGKGKQSKLQLWVERHGLTAVASGRRVSERYLRIYDKGVESGLTYYDGCLRYEGEFKGKLAHAYALALDATESWREQIYSSVAAFVSERNLQVSWAGSLNPAAIRGSCIRTRVQALKGRRARRIMWANVSVRPMVQVFIGAGELDVILEALGLAEHVIPKPRMVGPSWSSLEVS